MQSYGKSAALRLIFRVFLPVVFIYCVYLPINIISNMPRLTIRNIGPIRDLDINLNRINVIIGPQSSGKSTVAKIISFCQWLEKDLVVRQGLEHVDERLLVQVLIRYHNMGGYFRDDSAFSYLGDAISLEYADRKVKVSRTEGFASAPVSKNAYIPAERNLVALPGIASLEWPQFYLRNFLFDWLSIRDRFGRDEALTFNNLGVSYYYRPSDHENILVLPSGEEIQLNRASSGLQSATPLYVFLNYLTRWIYRNDVARSYDKQRTLDMGSARRALMEQAGLDPGRLDSILGGDDASEVKDAFEKMVTALVDAAEKGDADNPMMQRIKALRDSSARPKLSNIVIEEPEQNLFPATQAGLIYDILDMIDHNRDNLVITTHSPFILYALNNCMIAYGTPAAATGELELDFGPRSFVDPAIVSVWELRDGYIENYDGRRNVTIQDADGLIRSNYFDRVMSNIMADFTNLVSSR